MDGGARVELVLHQHPGQSLAQVLICRVHDFPPADVIRDKLVQADFMHTAVFFSVAFYRARGLRSFGLPDFFLKVWKSKRKASANSGLFGPTAWAAAKTDCTGGPYGYISNLAEPQQ